MYLANARITHFVSGTAAVEEAQRRIEPEALTKLGREAGFEEVAVLSTCNRLELFGAGLGERPRAGEALGELLSKALTKPGSKAPGSKVERAEGADAAAHLLRVATSLESMVVGESEILNQVKESYQRSRATGDIGPVLSAVFLRALRAGRLARASTGIGEGHVSIPALAVELAREHLPGARVLVIGAGRVASTLHKRLENAGCGQVVLANRSPEKLDGAAKKLGARVVPMSKLDEEVALADVVFSAISAKRPILEPGMFDGWHGLLVDLGVPANTSPRVAKECRIDYVGMEQLGRAAARNREKRKAEAEKVERILKDETAALLKDLETVGREGFGAAIMKYAEEIRQREIDRAAKFLGGAPDQSMGEWAANQRALEVMDMLTRSIVKKLTYYPIQALKSGVLDRAEADKFIEILTGGEDVPADEAPKAARERRD